MNVRRWHTYFLFLLALSALLMNVSFSRFAVTLANTGAEDAAPPPDITFSTWILEGEAQAVPLTGMTPGDSRTISIGIQNWTEGPSGEEVSGYSQRVTLELTTTGNLPLRFTLTKEGAGEVPLSHAGAHQYSSAAQSFSAGVGQTEAYVLTVSWPPEENDARYKDEIDYLELRLSATQA